MSSKGSDDTQEACVAACVADLLCVAGHSLGGAIALLCTLDLLHSLGDEPNPNVTCVGFATPAVGNAALAEYVKNKGWQKYITNYLVPGQSWIILYVLPQHIMHSSAFKYSLHVCRDRDGNDAFARSHLSP